MKNEIIYKNITEIKPYKNNAKKHNKKQVEEIANSIKEFGFRGAILIDKNNTVIAGHGRCLAAKKAGLKKVPCIYVDDLTEQQIKALRLVDNKVSESETDYKILDEELKDIFDVDMTVFGFDTKNLEDYFEEQEKEVKFKVSPKHEVHIICSNSTQCKKVYDMCVEYFSKQAKVELKEN